MTQVRQSDARRAQRHCCRWRHDRRPETGRTRTTCSGHTGRLEPNRPCLECGSVALRPRRGMLRPLLYCASDVRQGGYRQVDRQCLVQCRKARRYDREPRVRSRICSMSRYHGSRGANAPSRLPPESGPRHLLQVHRAFRSLCSHRLEGYRLPAGDDDGRVLASSPGRSSRPPQAGQHPPMAVDLGHMSRSCLSSRLCPIPCLVANDPAPGSGCRRHGGGHCP
jgi:hypothetical protein